MNDIQDGEASSVADRSREHMELVLPVRKITFWIERTLVSTYLFPFPLRVRNNRVSLYDELMTKKNGCTCSCTAWDSEIESLTSLIKFIKTAQRPVQPNRRSNAAA